MKASDRAISYGRAGGGLLLMLLAAGIACGPDPMPEVVNLSGEWILSDSISLFDPSNPFGTFGNRHTLCKRWGRPVQIERFLGDTAYVAQIQFGGSSSCAYDGVFDSPRPLQGSGSGGYLTVRGDSVSYVVTDDQFYAFYNRPFGIHYIGTVVSRDRLAGSFPTPYPARGTWELTRIP